MARTVLPPGFRFHPTDPELVVQYLRRKASGRKIAEGVIGDLEIYKHEPWELPDKAILDTKDQEWYFFSITDKKYPQGSRTSRTTARGYWKATGKDRQICSGTGCVGMKKTLVFYMGRVPHGKRTDWLMHEYRLDEEVEKTISNIQPFVLCRVRKKGGIGPRNGEQFGALHEPCEPESSTSFAVLPELSESFAIQEFVEDSGEADKAADLAAEIECHQSGDELEDDLNFLLSHDPPSIYVDHNNVIQDLPGEGSGDIFTLDPGDTLSKGQYAGTGGSGSGFQGDAMEAFHDLVHPTSEEREMLEELHYDCSGTQQDEQNLLVQSQIMNSMDEGFLDGFFEMDDLEVPIDDLLLDLPPVSDEGEDDSRDVEVNSWIQPRTPAIFDPGEHEVPHIVSHRVRLQVPTPLAVGHDGANNVGGSQNKEANVYYHGEYPSAMEVPMLISGDRNSLGFQNVLGRRIEDGATSSNALSGFDCASEVFVNTYISNTSLGSLTCEQLPAQSFNVRSLGGVDWKPVEGEGSYSACGADATAHMSLGKGDGASCSIRGTCVWGEEKVGIAKGPVVLLKEINRLLCATVPPPAHSPKFFSQLVLGVLGKAPAKPAFAVELPEDARLLAALCESRRAREEQGCTADMALQRSFARSSTSLSQRSKSPISSELNFYLKRCAGQDEISGLPSSDFKVVSTIGNGGGIRIFFRVATSLLIFACLSRGMCRLTRIALTIF